MVFLLQNYYNFWGDVVTVFSERLKIIRKSIGHTQKQVADGIGVAESYYQIYEYGRTEPKASNIAKLCRYFNISADYLLGLTDEPRPLREKDTNNDK